MRVVRWILGIAGAVVLLVVAAALIATLVIDPDRYRSDIESAVRGETGRPFVLEGHLRLSWFPWLGVRTGAARLGNPPGAGGPDLLEWRSAELRVRLLPLVLHRELEVGRIKIIGADIHLRRGPRGDGSWEDLIARLHPESDAAGGRAPAAEPATWAGLDLENSSLDYVDERSLEHVSLTDWHLSVGPWSAAEPLSVSTSFILHVDTAGTGASSAGAAAVRLPAAGVRVSLDVPGLKIHATPLEITALQWTMHVADATLEGAVDARRDGAGHLMASGSLTATAPSLRDLAHTLGIAVPTVEDPTALAALSLSGKWTYGDGALVLKPLAAKLDSTTLTGWAARSASPDPIWTFALRADQVDFGRYLTQPKEQKPPPQLSVRALQALRVRGTLELDRARIDGTTLRDVRLQVQ